MLPLDPTLTALDLLRRARVRLTDPERWLHDHPDGCVDADGNSLLVATNPAAVKWDLYNALCAESATEQTVDESLEYVEEASGETGGGSSFSAVLRWHDAEGRTHGDMLAVLDQAILQAERDEAVRPNPAAPAAPGSVQPLPALLDRTEGEPRAAAGSGGA